MTIEAAIQAGQAARASLIDQASAITIAVNERNPDFKEIDKKFIRLNGTVQEYVTQTTLQLNALTQTLTDLNATIEKAKKRQCKQRAWTITKRVGVIGAITAGATAYFFPSQSKTITDKLSEYTAPLISRAGNAAGSISGKISGWAASLQNYGSDIINSVSENTAAIGNFIGSNMGSFSDSLSWRLHNLPLDIASLVSQLPDQSTIDSATSSVSKFWDEAGETTIFGVDSRIVAGVAIPTIAISLALLHRACCKR